VLAGAALLPFLVAAQGPPGTNLTVRIQVESVVIHRDTTRVTYTLTNDRSSREQMFWFMVDAPSPVTWIFRPSPQKNWVTHRE
jgi:hypothetical protein